MMMRRVRMVETCCSYLRFKSRIQDKHEEEKEEEKFASKKVELIQPDTERTLTRERTLAR